jgi:hypothetical protein
MKKMRPGALLGLIFLNRPIRFGSLFMHKSCIIYTEVFCIVALAFSLNCRIKAVEAYSETFVATAVNIPGKSVGTIHYSMIAPPIVQPAIASGTISSVDSYSFVDLNADWSSSTVGSGYYVEFPSGLIADISNMNNSTKTISVGSYLPGNVSVGQKYKIRKHFTISEIFGPQNQAGLLGASSVLAADNLMFLDESTQATKTYYYNTSLNAWRRGITSGGNDIVRPGQGIIMGRRSGGDITIYLT